MPLSFQDVAVRFGQGIDTKTDAKSVIAGRLIDLQNGSFDKAGKIRKRNGYTALTQAKLGGGTVAAGSGLLVDGDELVMLADGEVLSNTDSLGWVGKDKILPVSVDSNSIMRGEEIDCVNTDFGFSGNIGVYCWADETYSLGGNTKRVVAKVVDLTTGTEIQSLAELANNCANHNPKIVVLGTNICVVYQTSTAGELAMRVVSAATPQTFAAEVVLATNGFATPADLFFDVAEVPASIDAGLTAVIAYRDTTTNVLVRRFDETGYLTQEATLATVIAPEAVAVLAGSFASANPGGTVYVSVIEGASHQAHSWDYADTPWSGATVTSPASGACNNGNVTAVEMDDGEVAVFVDVDTATGRSVDYDKAAITAISALSSTFYGFRLAGKAVLVGADVLIPTAYDHTTALGDVTTQPTSFLHRFTDVDAEEFSIEAAYLKGRGGGYPPQRGLPSFRLLSGSKYRIALPYKTALVGDEDGNYTLRGVMAVDFDLTNPNGVRDANGSYGLHVNGGILRLYDGAGLTETGFLLYPEIESAGSVAGGSVAAGTYSVVLVFEWTDSLGNVHRSAPSLAKEVVVGAGASKIQISLFNFNATNRFEPQRDNIRVVAYRTADAGTVYYRTADVANPEQLAAITIELLEADATLTDNELLYTTGGELPNISPGNARLITQHKDRLFVVSDDGRLWFSKKFIVNEGPGFSDAQVIDNPDGKTITAIHSIGDQLAVFTERAIYVVTGDGPNARGTGQPFSKPRRIDSDVGCDLNAPVVLYGAGVMFKSEKGFCVLSGALQASFIGAPIEDFNGLTFVSAVVVPVKNEIRLGHSDGVTLVYNYLFGQWSTFTNHTQVAAVLLGGNYVYLQADAQAYEQDSSFTDGTTAAISMLIETAWIKMQHLQGFQRVKWLSLIGEFLGPFTLNVDIYYDYADAAAQTLALSTTEQGQSVGTPLQLRIKPELQKCQSIKLRFSDTPLPGTGEAFSVSELMLSVGFKGRAPRLGAAKSA